MTAHREEQIAQAEELLADRPPQRGFVKGLFFGEYSEGALLPYPDFSDKHGLGQGDGLGERLEALRVFCRDHIDPVEIDRKALIPETVIHGLGKLGVLGACLPTHCGGGGLSQTAYCRLLEVLGGHCGGTALFVNAHHSIGPRAIVLFGTRDQQAAYLPKLATGQWLSAFALTEPNAGSDAANVQTQATPTEDGQSFVINGEKRWITNGGIAQVLTLMAKTPVPGAGEPKITAFIVTPDMPGFEVVEKRMEKLGVRGSATARLAFRNLIVPRANVLGQLGKGLKIALTVLDYGRTTFGASCTGAAKFCLRHARAHALTRIQFGQPLAEFELVQEKLAAMQAGVFAMEACTYQTATLMDEGDGDFMLETAMLKVFATETLWQILNDTFQLHGGKAYFTDEPWERMLRDARINTIGEGANDVLRAFSALVGMRDVGLELESVLHAVQAPLGSNLLRLGRFAGRKLGALLASPPVRVRSSALEEDAARIGKLVAGFGSQVEKLLRTHQKEILDKQLLLGRVADAGTELYVSACVLNRLDSMLRHAHDEDDALRLAVETGRYYLRVAARRIQARLAALWDHDDSWTTSLARRMLRAPAGG